MRRRLAAGLAIVYILSFATVAAEEAPDPTQPGTPVVETIEPEIIVSDEEPDDIAPIPKEKPEEKPEAPDETEPDEDEWSFHAEYGKNGMPIPQLYQEDYKKTICVVRHKKRSVASSGCSVTCLSMVVAYLTGDLEQTPETLFREAVELDLYHGNGLGKKELKQLATRHGVKAEWKKLTAKEALDMLEGGTPIIAHMGKGHFTDGGHYIVLRGVTKKGRVLVNDPASEKRTDKTYSMATIMKEMKKRNGFMVCVPEDGDVVGMLSSQERDGSLDAKELIVPHIDESAIEAGAAQ